MHFYDSLGNPVYEVERNDKQGLRPTTIRDARKLKLQPSVTTITGVLDKPGLLNYFLKQTIGAVFGEPDQGVDEEWDKYAERIISASRKESSKASSIGSKLHDALEKVYSEEKQLQEIEEQHRVFIVPVIQAIKEGIFDTKTWIAEASFSHVLGYGGKVDLYSPRDSGYIVDFKTKSTDNKKKFHKYDEHLMQLSAYRLGLNLPTARCFDVYFSSVEPGIVEVHEWTQEDLKQGEQMFLALLAYWKAANSYDSSHEKEKQA